MSGSHGKGRTSERKVDLSIVVPVYRSEEILPELYAEIKESLAARGFRWELVLVIDGSPDQSLQVAMDLRAADSRVGVIQLAQNNGQQRAALCGIQYASGAVVVTMDDDLQHSPADIPALIERMEEGFEIVIARLVPKRHTWARNVGSCAIQWLAYYILRKPKDITLSSFRCFSRRAADLVGAYEGPHPYLPALMFRSVPPELITNIDVQHHPRKHGRSGYSLRKLIHLSSYLLINHSQLPLRLMVFWGFLVSGMSVMYALVVLVRAMIGQVGVEGWASLAVLTAFLAGNILMAMGILGEYVGRLVKEASEPKRIDVFRVMVGEDDHR